MKIEMDKKYRTVVGHYPARIICTNRFDPVRNYAVVALVTRAGVEEVTVVDSQGYTWYGGQCHPYIEEVPEVDWSKVEIDTPVWVKKAHGAFPVHFAGMSPAGFPMYWTGGETSHTTINGIGVIVTDGTLVLEKPIL